MIGEVFMTETRVGKRKERDVQREKRGSEKKERVVQSDGRVYRGEFDGVGNKIVHDLPHAQLITCVYVCMLQTAECIAHHTTQHCESHTQLVACAWMYV
jgi:hypothetical protein